MIDIHSHLVFGFDDGASDRDCCCRMLELYAAGGVTEVVCTSHSSKDIDGKYDECFARSAGLAADFGIKLIPALEYSLPDILQSQHRPLGNSTYLLLDPGMFPVDSAMLTRLMPVNAAGYKILWAHPERLYGENTLKTVEKFTVLIGSACQLNAGSLTGAYGDDARTAAWELLENNRCAVIASDAHDPDGVANFIAVRKLLASLYPDEFIRLWFEINPARLLNSQIPERRQPPRLSLGKRIKRYFTCR